MSVLKGLLHIIMSIIIIVSIYWIAKNGSYWLWYEDMVKQTIEENVKQECLK